LNISIKNSFTMISILALSLSVDDIEFEKNFLHDIIIKRVLSIAVTNLQVKVYFSHPGQYLRTVI
jgi:hypothetical protein